MCRYCGRDLPKDAKARNNQEAAYLLTLSSKQDRGKDAKALNNQGMAYAKEGEYDLAVSTFNKAIEIDPKSAETYYIRGIAHYHNGQQDQAISDFNKAIRIDPNGETGRMAQKFLHGLTKGKSTP